MLGVAAAPQSGPQDGSGQDGAEEQRRAPPPRYVWAQAASLLQTLCAFLDSHRPRKVGQTG